MGIGNIISLMGGLGLFLFGMDYMGDGLELAAGARMKDLLEKLTNNPVMGFLLGAIVTIVIQSSSATTVMTMGFINAGIMTLAQATGVIFGANIGTTITSVLIALDVSGIAPVCICIGALMMLYSKKKGTKYIGQVILGFGLLFEGLHMMSSSMSSLRTFEPFTNFIAHANNPLLGFIVGVILCTVIQSSSAAVGVLQALAMQGMMPLGFAAYLICGVNVGSSTPVLLASLNAKNNAKRAAMVYLIFNIIGTILFMPIAMFTPLTSIITAHIAEGAFQISVFHILFKVVTGVLMLPFVNVVVGWTYILVPKQAHESDFRLVYIDPNFDGAPSVSALQVQKEVERMAEFVRSNITDAMNGLLEGTLKQSSKIADREQVIDYLASGITDFISNMNTREYPAEVAHALTRAFHVVNDLEQIGDHAVKLNHQNERLTEQKQEYSEVARSELHEVFNLDDSLLVSAMEYYKAGAISAENWRALKKQERKVNELVSNSQQLHMQRMQEGNCTFERGLTFVESMNSLQRIVNHAMNIAETVVKSDSVAVVYEDDDDDDY